MEARRVPAHQNITKMHSSTACLREAQLKSENKFRFCLERHESCFETRANLCILIKVGSTRKREQSFGDVCAMYAGLPLAESPMKCLPVEGFVYTLYLHETDGEMA
jgi:hypothetical protein